MRDLALALLIFGLIPFIFMRPYLGLLVWSWLGYMNPNRLCYGFAVNFPWVQLVAIVTLIALFMSKENKKVPRSTISVLLFLFLLSTALSTLFAAELAAAWGKWQEFAKILVMVFVTLIVVNTRERMHWLVWMIVVSLGFYGLKGGVFTLTHGGNFHVVGPAKSFIGDNNALALALCMTLPLMRYLQMHIGRRILRIGMGVAMALTGVAILGTYSRGGLIGLAIVGLAMLIKSRHKFTILVAVAVIGSAGYQFMPPQWTARMDTLHHAKKTSSGETRIQSWKFATNVALHQPLTGGGFYVYRSTSLWSRYAPPDSRPRAIHSIYFRTLGEQGFPGLALFLGLLLATWRNCSKVRRLTRGQEHHRWAFDLASMLQVSLLAFLASGAFLPMPYFDLTYQLMALSAVLAALVLRQVNESESESESEPGAHTSTSTPPHTLRLRGTS